MGSSAKGMAVRGYRMRFQLLGLARRVMPVVGLASRATALAAGPSQDPFTSDPAWFREPSSIDSSKRKRPSQ
jgi:hypothetical protein